MKNLEKFLLFGLLFLVPVFFLPVTQEYFITNKFYLLVFGILLLLLVSSFQILFSKKLTWSTKPLDLPVVLFIASASLSVVFSSANKIQALINPSVGLLVFLSLSVLYFFISRNLETVKHWANVLTFSSFLLAVFAIAFFFEPFKKVNLSTALQFLKNPSFTPMGNQLDLVALLGFTLIIGFFWLIQKKKSLIFNAVFLVVNFLAIGLTAYSLFKNPLLLPPFSNSWFSALEVLKNAKTALFGAGIDNFAVIFTRVKDLSYNQTTLWQIPGFNVARNSILNIFTEMGLLGVVTFAFLIFYGFKIVLSQLKNKHDYLLISLFSYLVICLLVLPPSLPIFFLFFVVLAVVSFENGQTNKEVELGEFPFVYFGIVLVMMAIVAVSGFLLGQSYLAEYKFKLAINALSTNNGQAVYDNIKAARTLNPYLEKYVVNFAQTNLLLADSIARKEASKITEADRQTIAQAVQAAISEAKELVRLNPDKATSYANLANIYQNIIPITTGADVWTISSYQRAIVLDPFNPVYRLNLGGVYYLLGRYGDAVNLFEQAISIKADWPNGFYNLAWGYYQNKEFDKAATAMQNVLKMLDKKTDPQDWNKANTDLTTFKNKLAAVEKESTTSGNLNLPAKATKDLEPKLNLPPEASPGAK